ncbi:caspase, EACC1-associated type [Nocardia concava]|uniref:caspase, EACC1-associated type n=1 Tax=Nocardia concava TaxID=257281 RepID=UPI000594565A|nr:caspase family protein [Nocardia concava]
MTLPDPEASRAVLIGTASYGADSGFKSFPEIARSLTDFAGFLRTETGIPERHIEVVLDPSDSSAIAAKVTAAAQAATGLLLIYYVGHGAVVDNQLHLTHTGSRVDDADVTALGYPILRSRIKANARGPVVVILDCCHSGRAVGREVLAGDSEILRAATDIDGAFVLTATDEKTKFALAKGDGGRTAFTAMMLDILRTGVPTADRYLTMSVLYRELRDRLPAANMPKPKALERGTAGRVALAANPAWTGRSAPELLPTTSVTPYLAQIRDLTPDDGLLDRETELAELAEFCWGEEAYVWWQAGPWAGKTAIMTWFALHPPPNVHVVSFFITSRLAAQDDHNAFTDAVVEQLSALLPDEAATVARVNPNRDALRRHLLDIAAQRAANSGRRILLLVDGLDEDRGSPSIASLLPRHPGPGLRVVVAGRPNPGLPLDVPGSHPLHHCRRREVERSRTAFDIIQAARLELRGILDRSDVDQEILGLITAAHGLTGAELEDLTGLPPFRIDRVLSGATGRTFRAQSSRFAADQIHLLAHETLQREAETALGRVLMGTYHRRIHEWAIGYRARGWPVETPTYLLTRYFSMLRGRGDIARMTELALDTARHDRMLELTGGDGIARTEIGTVSALWLGNQDPDLLAVCKLAMRRRHLTQRGRDIPTRLPAAFALLGELARAQSLADGIPLRGRRVQARIAVIAVQFGAADRRRNRRLVDSLRGSGDRVLDDSGLGELAAALVAAGDVETAEELAHEITTPWERVRILAQLVSVWWQEGRQAEVAAAMTEINRHVLLVKAAERRDEILGYAAAAFADTRDFERALALADTLRTLEDLVAARCRIARAMVGHGATESARGWVHSVLATSGRATVADPIGRSRVLGRIAGDLVAAGFSDELREQVDDLAAQVAGCAPRAAVAVLEGLVRCLVELGEADRAIELADRFSSGTAQLDLLTDTLPALVAAGRSTRARRLAADIELTSYRTPPDPYRRGFPLHTLVRALAAAGDLTRAHAVVDRIDDTGCQFLVFTYLGTRAGESAARADDFLDRALNTVNGLLGQVETWDEQATDAFARTVLGTDWLGRDRVESSPTPLTELVRTLLARGAIDVAAGLADRLASLYSIWFESADSLDRGLGELAAVFVESGRADIAARMIATIPGLLRRLTVLQLLVERLDGDQVAPIVKPMLDEVEDEVMTGRLTEQPLNRVRLAQLSAAVGDADRVARLMDGLTDVGPAAQRIVSSLATARARAGAIDEAAAIAGAISDRAERTRACGEVVTAQIRAGRERAALHSATRIPEPAERIRLLALVIPALAQKFGPAAGHTTLLEATSLLATIDSAAHRDRAAAVLVDAALTIGSIDHAHELADSVESDLRPTLLSRIADALVATLDDIPPSDRDASRRRIRRILAEIWGSGRWYSALDALARFDPPLLAEIADEAVRFDASGR